MMKLPNQKGMVIWMLGLSGAGKSTIANLLKEQLEDNDIFSIRLDGDEMRQGLNKNLGFSMEDRAENIRRAAEAAKILASNGIIVICSFITPLHIHREIAKEILQDFYFEVFVDCPLEVCEQRDVKGLYKLANEHTLKNFTGISSLFEEPAHSHLNLLTATHTPRQCCDHLYTALKTQQPSILSQDFILSADEICKT
ncbi:adenylyl-sulfate kinase [Pedobacter sp. AW31-3R]|uniref:adenylyl-sulfate kinase n=1 Tax=Pedobacter sp. AW31-3R TaxID=3445781 RepID=UPI003FA13945